MRSKNFLKSFFIFLVAIVLLVFIIIFFFALSSNNRNQIVSDAIIGNKKISIEVVRSAQDMMKGLGGRKSLASDAGMLFLYNNYATPGFWMKDMEFPLDLIWIRDGSVVGIEKNVPVISSGTLPLYSPKEPINMVLEVNSGFSDSNQVQTGSQFRMLTK